MVHSVMYQKIFSRFCSIMEKKFRKFPVLCKLKAIFVGRKAKIMKISYATISKCGKRRVNEDTFRVWEEPMLNRWTGLVCDGLGGHYLGDACSQCIADGILDFWKEHADEPDSAEKVQRACKAAFEDLKKLSDRERVREMGTTLVMASVHDDMLTIAHVGDSRCYVQQPGLNLEHVTRDHVRVDFGWDVLDRCFFADRDEAPVAEVAQLKISAGDRILLCSDGLYKSMYPYVLTGRMMDNQTPEQILDVYDFLCEKNGDDNYTGILAFVSE